MPITKNVKLAVEALKADPVLLKDFNAVFTKAFSKAKVSLTNTEKAAFLTELSKQIIAKNAAVVAWI